jgi:uncharacterized protein YbaP (TraB family)
VGRGAWRAWLAIVPVLACVSRPPPPPPPAAFYWEAHGPGGAVLFLLGSVHIGDGRELLVPARVEADWARAEALVVEVDVHGMPDLERLEAVQRYGLLRAEERLEDLVSLGTRESLVAYLQAHGYPLAPAGRMRPWLLAQQVTQIAFESAGYEAENGVDAWFLRRAEQEGRPIGQLESLEEQMSLFGALTPTVEEALLREVLEQTDALVATMRRIVAAWERGDEAQLLDLLLGSRRDPRLAAFHRAVFVERNHRMAGRLAALAGDGRARFVVVGTGHLIGPESVPDLLEGWGFSVERHPEAFVRAAPPVLGWPPAGVEAPP